MQECCSFFEEKHVWWACYGTFQPLNFWILLQCALTRHINGGWGKEVVQNQTKTRALCCRLNMDRHIWCWYYLVYTRVWFLVIDLDLHSLSRSWERCAEIWMCMWLSHCYRRCLLCFSLSLASAWSGVVLVDSTFLLVLVAPPVLWFDPSRVTFRVLQNDTHDFAIDFNSPKHNNVGSTPYHALQGCLYSGPFLSNPIQCSSLRWIALVSFKVYCNEVVSCLRI